MLKAILWKEWRSQATLLIAIVVFGFVLIATVAFGMPNEWARRPQSHGMIGMLAIALIALAAGQAALTGAMLFAGEIEDQTLAHLDQHAGRRRPVWLRKMAAGFAFTFGVSGILAMAIIALGITSPRLGVLCVWLSIHAFLFAAACSVGVSTTFRAIGLTLLGLSPILGLCSISMNSEGTTDFSVNKFALAAATMAISYCRFCWPDLSRGTEPSRIQLLLERWTFPRWWAVSIGIAWKRHATGLSIAIALLPVGVWYAAGALSISGSMFVLFLFGAYCGWAVFADDVGAERFLGDQRLPLGRLWCGKVMTWLIVCVVVCFVAGIIFAYRWFRIERIYEYLLAHGWETPSHHVFRLPMISGIYGFALAQIFVLWIRRTPIALLLTIVLGIGTGVVWLSMLLGGMAIWALLVVPGFLLLCGRLLMRRWAAERLHDRGGILRFTGMMGLVAIWLAGSIWWRATSVPDVGEPFDMQAFMREADAPPPADSSGPPLLAAANEMTSQYEPLVKLVRNSAGELALTDHPEKLNPAMVFSRLDSIGFVGDIVSEGIPEGAERLEAFLDQFMNAEWVEQFRAAAAKPPDGSLVRQRHWQEPRFDETRVFRDELRAVFQAGHWFVVRAMWNHRRGKKADALKDIECALATARHGSHRAGPQPFRRSSGIRQDAICAIDWDLLRGETDPSILRAIMKVLEADEARLPSLSYCVKASYAAGTPRVPYTADNWFDQWLWKRPWEEVRRDRLLRAGILGMIEEADDGAFRKWVSYGGNYCVNSRVPGWKTEDWERIASRTYPRFGLSYFLPISAQFDRIHILHNSRGLRLKIACMLCQIETGKSVQSLNDLVPEYFAVLPKDPVVGREFGYTTDPAAIKRLELWGRRAGSFQPGDGVISYSRQGIVVPNLLKK